MITLTIESTSGSFDEEVGYEIYDYQGNMIDSIGFNDFIGSNNYQIEVPSGNFILHTSDLFGDGWNGASITISNFETGEIYLLDGTNEQNGGYEWR